MRSRQGGPRRRNVEGGGGGRQGGPRRRRGNPEPLAPPAECSRCGRAAWLRHTASDGLVCEICLEKEEAQP